MCTTYFVRELSPLFDCFYISHFHYFHHIRDKAGDRDVHISRSEGSSINSVFLQLSVRRRDYRTNEKVIQQIRWC